jgi:hypothetical protein
MSLLLLFNNYIDATVNTSGVSATGTIGTVSVVAPAVLNTAGMSVTGTIGIVAVSVVSNVSISATGVSCTSSTGTTGTPSTWTPSNLATPPYHWWDAQDISSITKDGSNFVSQWNNKGVAASNATEATNKPTYVASSTPLSNNPAIRFTATDAVKLNFSGSLGGLTAINMSSGLTDRYRMTFGGNQVSATGFSNIASETVFSTVWTTTAANYYDCGNVASQTAVTIAAAGSFFSVATLGSALGATSPRLYSSGSLGSSNGVGALNGDLGELVYLAYSASTSDRQLVEGYLAWRWGKQASLPATHPYIAASPKFGGVVGDATINASGVSGASNVGTVNSVIGTATVSTTSVSATGTIGNVITNASADITVSGVSVTSNIGSSVIIIPASSFFDGFDAGIISPLTWVSSSTIPISSASVIESGSALNFFWVANYQDGFGRSIILRTNTSSLLLDATNDAVFWDTGLQQTDSFTLRIATASLAGGGIAYAFIQPPKEGSDTIGYGKLSTTSGSFSSTFVTGSAARRYYKIQHSASAFHYRISSDGMRWTTMDSMSCDFDTTKTVIEFSFRNNIFGVTGSDAYSIVRGVNVLDQSILTSGFLLSSSIGASSVTVPVQNPNVTGLLLSSSIGSPTVSGRATRTQTGVSVSSSIGPASPVAVTIRNQTGLLLSSSVGNRVVIGNAVRSQTGILVSSSIGSVNPVGNANRTQTGVTGTSALGNETVVVDATINATGFNLSDAIGTSNVVGDAVVPTSGVSVTGTIGTVSPVATTLVNPSGVSCTGVIGASVVSGTSGNSISGVTATSVIGNVSVDARTDIFVTGVTISAQVGTVVISGTAVEDTTGNQNTIFVGTTTTTADARAPPSGVDASSSIGNSSIAIDVILTESGVIGTTAPGNSAVVANASVNTTGVAISGTVGNVAANTNNDLQISPSGVSISNVIGDVVVSGTANISQTGTASSGQLGTVDSSGTASNSISGVASSTATGTIAVDARTIESTTGVSSAGDVGSSNLSADANNAASGAEIASHIGDVASVADADVVTSGVSVSSNIGSSAFSGTSVENVNGIDLAAVVGNSVVTADANIGTTGTTATSQIGDVFVTLLTVPVSGVEATVQIGSVTITQTATVDLIGIDVYGQVGIILFAVPVPPDIAPVFQRPPSAGGGGSSGKRIPASLTKTKVDKTKRIVHVKVIIGREEFEQTIEPSEIRVKVVNIELSESLIDPTMRIGVSNITIT